MLSIGSLLNGKSIDAAQLGMTDEDANALETELEAGLSFTINGKAPDKTSATTLYAKYDRIIPVLVEVNVAGEDTKFGVLPEDANALVRQISALPHVAVRGYMTSAPYTDTPEENRVYFRKLRELSVDTHLKNYNNVNMGVLSMGMSNDYEVAVEEGATLVRVGTSIFGARQYVNR